MNYETEGFLGELAQLRAREVKLAKLITIVEEHLQGGFASEYNTGAVTERDVRRLLEDPDIANWMDNMRRTNQAPFKRFPGSRE